jgi:hypothetical protein
MAVTNGDPRRAVRISIAGAGRKTRCFAMKR